MSLAHRIPVDIGDSDLRHLRQLGCGGLGDGVAVVGRRSTGTGLPLPLGQPGADDRDDHVALPGPFGGLR
ncbi:hypothetical protein OCAE111667_12405 [Occultella aeris]|uniref:Uncharacterized protein n=1 Tax=Occultella aeris TaxID=2761496 RepID=A0A7M4DFG0_9MICO|nr:hypothetical protein HALOF300_00851 [Occultella aeris]